MTTRQLRRALLGTIALGALPLALFPAVSWAQMVQASNAGSTSLSEVVVTAQKRTEKLQDTPVSVSVVSGAKLEETQATTMADWSSYVPGLALGAGGSRNGTARARPVEHARGRAPASAPLGALS